MNRFFLLIFCIVNLSYCKKDSTINQSNNSITFYKGADVSWITEMESSGVKFYNSEVQQECLSLLKQKGLNAIRLRVWVNPTNGWNNSNDVLTKAIRANDLGFKLLIDFHYSDSWADPAQQTKPASWVTQDIQQLKTSVYNHTYQVLQQLKTNGVIPLWVQVGNETNDGMLWPEGKASSNMNNFASFINAGYDAVKANDSSTKVIVHLSNGYDKNLFTWMFDGLKNNAAKYDVIGMSLYPSITNWQTLNNQCIANINHLTTTYNKEVMICEVGMPWDSPDESKNFLKDLISQTKAIANNRVLGVFYWEPQAYNNWKGYTLGAFDNAGKPTIALDAFK
ncbi:MAG: glycoside hydrolase family 53 protein [Chitinophagaceae bacterium]